ncbi:MAG TPA: class I SAM-dependent methyltransferase [Polyangia bacterium]
MHAPGFVEIQRRHYERADPRHYRWQTEAPWFSAAEAALIAGVAARPGERVLEVGCGDGGNLCHLGRACPEAARFGVDFSPAKAAFAQQATGARTAAADAAHLPFADQSFDAILIRDLLHHLPDRPRALAEARRVLRPGGRLTLIEPNRRAPLVLLQAALVRAERGLFASTAERLERELAAAGFQLLSAEKRQPFPLGRVILHARLGADRLGALSPVRAALDAFDSLMGRVVPRRAWLYLVYSAMRPKES